MKRKSAGAGQKAPSAGRGPRNWCPVTGARFRLLLPFADGTRVSREGTDPISTLPQAYCVSRLAVDGPMRVT